MTEKLKAVGIHVFAGGFTRGVIDAGWDVELQLETHNFAVETTKKLNGIEVINDENADWPHVDALMAFGNPRCTAFSTITSGPRYLETNAHGAWAKQTCDIHQMCEYGAGRYDFLIWESVQQAYTGSGKELCDYLVREIFAPKNYRVAHLLLNAASFGNTQQRKRYFFVAYRDCYRFNVEPPIIEPYYPVLADAIWSQRNRKTRAEELWRDDIEYDRDCYQELSEHDTYILPNLPSGWSLQTMAKYGYHLLSDRHKRKWDERESELPFSLHGITRLTWLRPCPTLHSSACRFIHPSLHRPLTAGELAIIMGWPEGSCPVGKSPAAQIAKGICPAVGTWLARQVELSYKNHWSSDDWESSYDDTTSQWEGRDTSGEREKRYDLTRYVGKFFDKDRYDEELTRLHRFNVDERTGRLVHTWDKIAQQTRLDDRGRRVVSNITRPAAELPAE